MGSDMYGFLPLFNKIQEYTWGSYRDIAGLLGLPVPSPVPQAELWMGAHPKAPSEVFLRGERVPLNAVIERDPSGVLGAWAAKRFSGELPFLFKVLAAASPLSIQAHPDLDQARRGFERENKKNIPVDAYDRSYRDQNHKPEILCALTEFWTMSGFRPFNRMLEILDVMTLRSIGREIKAFKKRPDTSGLKTFFHSLLSLPKDRVASLGREALKWAGSVAGETDAFFEPIKRWVGRIGTRYPSDIGILSPALLNLVLLKPGEAMYTPAGVLHAYLEGCGIELMANSDNVLRGGLTDKFIDIPELLRTVRYEPASSIQVATIEREQGETLYDTPADEFILSKITLKKSKPYKSVSKRSVEILLCTHGSCSYTTLDGEYEHALKKGESVLVCSSMPEYEIQGDAVLFKAFVPLPEDTASL
ncbi:MAG: mannose-6-phosphate isomerase, class I [Spirochaetes bacterium]|nr:mannose-6-phosphate isomerase, class I [Spirochaetota bacterium]